MPSPSDLSEFQRAAGARATRINVLPFPSIPDAIKGHVPELADAWQELETNIEHWRKSMDFPQPTAVPNLEGRVTAAGSTAVASGGTSGSGGSTSPKKTVINQTIVQGADEEDLKGLYLMSLIGF